MANLQLRSVEKVYGNAFKAVHGIDLDVEDGEFMVLVGPSGCAKSTTLRMIAGLETITSGEIRIGERVVNNLVPGDRGIAMVFQNYALYPHMKVRNNLSFGLRIKRKPKGEIAEGVDRVSHILEIDELLDRLPKQLSGGQAQRVAVGRALIKQPEVFLFDEPLSNLDAKLRASMRVRITDLHKQLKQTTTSSTVVYVTHDQTEAMTMGDRIVVMKDGVIQQIGAPLEIYDNPVNVFVAGFIGTPPMNFIDCVLLKEEDDYWVKTPAFRLKIHPDRARQIQNIDAYVGKEVILGIRPEDIHDAKISPGPEDATVVAMADVTEPMGSEVIAYFSKGDAQFVARIDPHTEATDGEEHPVSFNMKKIHLFDKETELVIK